MKIIASRQNPLVRAFRDLAATPDPAGARLLLDGAHQVHDARDAGLRFEAVAVRAADVEADTETGALARALHAGGVPVFTASDAAFAAMSPVRSPSGVVAIAARVPVGAGTICAREEAFVVAVADVQDPGNLGAIVRAAEAGGATGVLVCGASANPFSWKSLRGSMGSALRLPVAAGMSVDAALQYGAEAGARTVAAVPRDGRTPDEIRWTGRVMILLGGEGGGLPGGIVARCDDRVTIPMTPPVESLNVAVAAGVLVYAARRQRA